MFSPDNGRPGMSKLRTLSLWAGILGAAAAVYFPLHFELKAEQKTQEAERKADENARVDRTAQAQKDWGMLLHRLTYDEAAIAFLETQMPKDKREILRAVSEVQQQAQIQEQQTPLRVTKGISSPETREERRRPKVETRKTRKPE